MKTRNGDGGNKDQERGGRRLEEGGPDESGGRATIPELKTTIKRFEDLEVWKEGMQLAVGVYQAMAHSRDYSLRDQMQRAAVSVPSNIAEGYERESNRAFVQFLNYSLGSGGELRTQIYLAAKLGQLEQPAAKNLLDKSRKVSAMLYKYIQVRKKNF